MNKELDNKVVNFYVSTTQMCIYLKYICKVLPLVELQSIPGAPKYLAGMMHLNNNAIPVIDLGIRFGMDRKDKYDINTNILLCQRKSNYLGIIIDRIVDLATIEKNALQPLDQINQSGQFFMGIYNNHASSSLLIDIDKLFDSMNLIQEQESVHDPE